MAEQIYPEPIIGALVFNLDGDVLLLRLRLPRFDGQRVKGSYHNTLVQKLPDCDSPKLNAVVYDYRKLR